MDFLRGLEFGYTDTCTSSRSFGLGLDGDIAAALPYLIRLLAVLPSASVECLGGEGTQVFVSHPSEANDVLPRLQGRGKDDLVHDLHVVCSQQRPTVRVGNSHSPSRPSLHSHGPHSPEQRQRLVILFGSGCVPLRSMQSATSSQRGAKDGAPSSEP